MHRFEPYSGSTKSIFATKYNEVPSFEEWRKLGKVLFFGNGSDKCREVLYGTSSIFVGGVQPSATTVGVVAHSQYLNQETEDLAYFEPFYLKEFRTTIPKNKSGISNGTGKT